MKNGDPFAAYEEHVTTPEALTLLIGEPQGFVLNKELAELDALCESYIESSPFVLLGTVGADGHVDLSPKGDAPGFVKVLSPSMLAIPDRPGNRRLDSMHNILERPQVGLIFLIPGHGETLRVRGQARIVRDTALCESMAVNGRVPKVVLLIDVHTAFVHCPKCIIRSHLWEPEEWMDVSALEGIGQAMKKHARLKGTVEELEAQAQKDGLLDLY